MARQQTNFNPATKEFEAYLDFSGGYNSEVSNERLADHEFVQMVNVDNSGRGSAKTRTGRVNLPHPSSIGGENAQGMFNFYRAGAESPDIVIAASGYLYVWSRETNNLTDIPISEDGKPGFRFQQTLPIEAAQYRNNLFIATGTKLVELTANDSGVYSAKVVEPYKPTAQEVQYIGTNALAANPDDYIQDAVGELKVIGIKPATRQGAVNTPVNMTAFIARPANDPGTVDYQWEYKKSSDTDWIVHQAYLANAKTQSFTFDTATNYDIKLTIQKTGTSTPRPTYTLTNFTVKATADPISVPTDAMQRCRKIILHWDRILLAGDDKYPYQMYISDLENPRYFPTTNSIGFDYGKQEPITSIVRFQDMLVIFTRSTIQTLVGKSTSSYARYLIHDGLGSIAPRSAVVVGNNVLFLSHSGIYALKPNPYREETMNVARIDQAIQSEVKDFKDVTTVCAMEHDGQYWISFPEQRSIFRYYYERKVWVKDSSDGLNYTQFLVSGKDVFNLGKDGKFFRHDGNHYKDGDVEYRMEVESKFYDLSSSFNNKKLKRIFMLAKHEKGYDVDIFTTVKADSAIVLTPESGKMVTDDPEGWYWQMNTAPNFEFLRGTSFGTWVLGESPFGDVELSVQRASIRGKCRRVKISFYVPSSTPCEVYGFAFQFKLKKV